MSEGQQVLAHFAQKSLLCLKKEKEMIQIIVDSEETRQDLIAESRYIHDNIHLNSDLCNTLMGLHLLPDEAWIIKEKELFLTKDGKYVKPGDTVWVQGSCGVENSSVQKLEALTGYELFGKIPVCYSYSSEEEAYKARYGEDRYKKILKADRKEAKKEAEKWINKTLNRNK